MINSGTEVRNKSFATVTVGVANLDLALDLWVNTFGMESVASTNGHDTELQRLWSLSDGDIARQALIGTPGKTEGRIHFVEFDRPGPPVRQGAATFDSCPKNLDIYVDDMAIRIEGLKARGHRFKSDDFSEIVAPNGDRVREIHLPAHDGLNIVLLQMVDEKIDFSPQGFSGVGPIITTVADAEKEREFYQSVLDLELVAEDVLVGAEIETMIGLPSGAGLHFSVWGNPLAPFGRMEIIKYEGVSGADLFARAAPKALGILHVAYRTSSLKHLIERLETFGISHLDHGHIELLSGSGKVISFRSPAGFRIEVCQID